MVHAADDEFAPFDTTAGHPSDVQSLLLDLVSAEKVIRDSSTWTFVDSDGAAKLRHRASFLYLAFVRILQLFRLLRRGSDVWAPKTLPGAVTRMNVLKRRSTRRSRGAIHPWSYRISNGSTEVENGRAGHRVVPGQHIGSTSRHPQGSSPWIRR